MTRAVVFRTPGKLDLRSLTVFGMNSKPNSENPIGRFGTGLKYAIAVLMREHAKVTIWIGDQRWTVGTQDSKFRDKDFQSIILTRHKKFLPDASRVLPYTTEFGMNWTYWQAFRELEANTRDEQGMSYFIDTSSQDVLFKHNETVIIVESEQFVEQFHRMDEIFLPSALTSPSAETKDIQVFPERSKYLYYRSVRVQELEKPSNITYNILRRIELTEDRTIGSQYEIKWLIEKFLAEQADEPTIRQVITGPRDSFERRDIDWNYTNVTPSEAFIETVSEAQAPSEDGEEKPEVMGAASRLVKRHTEKDKPKKKLEPWIDEAITNLENGWLSSFSDLAIDHRDRMAEIFKEATRIEDDTAIEIEPKPEALLDHRFVEAKPIVLKEELEDEIPF